MKKKIFSLIGAIVIIALMFFNVQFSNNGNNGNFTLSSILKQQVASAEIGLPGEKWDAEYPECEFSMEIGIPPLVIIKTIKGSYRNCVSGTGVCVWNDPVCCVRIGGICML